jgi:hypothetical protein
MLVGLVPGFAFGVIVQSSDFTGFRTTPDGLGVVASDGWTQTYGGFKVEWAITGPTDGWYTYTYRFTDNADTPIPLKPDMSHLILEVSTSFTTDNIRNANVGMDNVKGPQWWYDTTDDNSNPNMPSEGIYGIKFDVGSESTYPVGTYSFESNKQPVWGDFYAKDGKHDPDKKGPEPEVWATAWNTGFGTDPTSSTTDFKPWIPTPDTFQPEPQPIPEPAGLVIWSILGGGAAALTALRRRRAGADPQPRWSEENRAAIHDLIARRRH